MTFMKINLHTHTINSDGANGILQMAQEAKKLGHCALCITDHSYGSQSPYSVSKSEVEALNASQQLPIPVIVGSEILTPFGEMLLFGDEVNRNWILYSYELEDYLDINSETYWKMFEKLVLQNSTSPSKGTPKSEFSKQKLNYALILCHPRTNLDLYKAYPSKMYELLHGYEIQNGNTEYEKIAPLVCAYLKSKIKNCKEFRNSDAHHTLSLIFCANEINFVPENETDLINWIIS